MDLQSGGAQRDMCVCVCVCEARSKGRGLDMRSDTMITPSQYILHTLLGNHGFLHGRKVRVYTI
eukprot:scaffold57800_cov20-Tisochrysis_lutea.AAC.3